MKIVMIIVRTLMGLLFIFGSVVYFLNLIPPPADLPPKLITFMTGVEATGYLMTLIKLTELVCGLDFVSGLFVPLATVVIAPVIINIFFVHLFLAPSGIGPAVFLGLGNCFFASFFCAPSAPLLRPTT